MGGRGLEASSQLAALLQGSLLLHLSLRAARNSSTHC
jgi:hypothetical protein